MKYVLVLVWCMVIFFFSSLTTTPTPKDTVLNFVLKKGAHVGEYTILYWLSFRAVNAERRRKKNFVGPLVFTLLFALTDEVHQSFVPGRHARVYDIGFDTLGALLATARLKSFARKSGRRS